MLEPMLYKLLTLSAFLSALTIPVNAQVTKQDITKTWHRGAFDWEDKKQFTSYQFTGKGSEFAVGFIYPGSALQWNMRLPSVAIIDCKSQESISGWLTVNSTDEELMKDSEKTTRLFAQLVADFCVTHKTLYPNAPIYQSN